MIRIIVFCILITGFDVWRLVSPDMILADATGFGVPLWLKVVCVALFAASTLRLKGFLYTTSVLALAFVLGIHVSFSQLGNLSGQLFSLLPLGLEIEICRDEEDSAMKLGDLATTDWSTLAHLQRSVTCTGKSGAIFRYAYPWVNEGPA